MRIQQFTIFTPKTNNLQTSKSQRLHFGNKPCGDEYRVKEVDYKGSKIPYVYIDNDYKSSLGDDELEKSIRTAFRDDEIFDDKKDSVDSLYRHYDDNDVVSPKEFYIKANDDYLLKRNLLINRNKDFEVDISYPEILYKRIKVEKDPFDYTKMLPKQTKINAIKDAYKQIDEMSYLKKGDRLIYSFELSECLLDKYRRKHPLSEIKKMLPYAIDTSYVIYNKKEYKTENFDNFYIDKYFDLKDSKKIKNTTEFDKIMKLLKSGYRGMDKYVIDLIADLSQKASLDEVLDVWEREKICCESSWNIKNCYDEIFEKLTKIKK